MHTDTGTQRHAGTHSNCLPRCCLTQAVASAPQDQHQRQRHTDVPPLQVEYYPPNGTFSLHYFPYYGKKAQVGAHFSLGRYAPLFPWQV